ncbi:uncharacterized protein LOC106178758 [Lingula anatina]|uniref:Uncharacterized protein LOC106178758 n=1 Tax=Lingula anatina TaxID=7574 RepID=A0A1S3K4T4_LINAN|nr:uncharacterized protein LOC106178758 [Lingula anatina]|eukprot:XP_013417527.1 uncharacterized protein LOC106178758 [Lingula anatina]
MKIFVASTFLVFAVFCVLEGLAKQECKCVPEQCCEETADGCRECPQGAVSCAKTNTRDCRDVGAMDTAELEKLLESLLEEREGGRSARSAESEDKEDLMKKIQELVEERKY